MRSDPKPERRTLQAKNAWSCNRSGLLPVHVQRNTPILAICLATLLLTACEKKEEPHAPPAPEVEVTEVVQQDVPIYQEFVAQLNGPINADITPKVQGYLLKQNYQNGFFVKKGQLLFEIDPRPFVAAQATEEVLRRALRETTREHRARDVPPSLHM